MASRFTIEGVFKGTDGFSRVAARVSDSVGRFSSRVGSTLKDVDKFTSKTIGGLADMAKQAAVVGAVMGGVVGIGLEHIVKAGAGFEQSITNVGAVMGKSRGQIQDLEKEAMRLGVVTQFSSSEVAEAMEFMAKKGFDSSEILAGIPGVLNAVAASGQDMAEVATVVGSSIRGFGLEAGAAGHVANILAFVAEKTGATITDLGTSLATAAPTAKALGVSIEDTATAVGLLQKVGLDASTAGSAVSTMLAKISKPSSEAAGKMTALGIKFKDATGNMLPFRDVLGQFVKAGDKAGGNMDRMAFFAELVGLRGDKAALALSDMSKAGDFDKLAKGVKNVGDYAGKVAAIRLDTTQGSWKLLTSTVEVLETKLFNLKSGALRGVIDATNQWLQANQDLIQTKAIDFIENARFAVDAFGRGAREGFSAARIGLDLFLGPLERLGIHVLGMGTWPDTIKSVGIAFGFLAGVVGMFLLFAGAVKAARVAVVAYEAVVWGANAAIGIYNFLTGGSAVVTGVSTAAMVAGRVALVAIRIAQWAHNAALAVGAFATGRITLAMVAEKIATIASTGWTWLANTARTALTASTVLGTVASGEFTAAAGLGTAATTELTGATIAADGAMGAFAVTLGVALAAVGALYLAYTQWKELEAVSGGFEGVKAGLGGVLNGEGYAKGVDDYQNSQARDAAEVRDAGRPMAAPSATQSLEQTIHESYTENTGALNITAPAGYGMAVQQPKGGYKIHVQPSGSP